MIQNNRTTKNTPTLNAPCNKRITFTDKKVFPHRVTKKVNQILESVSNNCEQCLEYSVLRFQFLTRIPKENVILNRELAIDLIWLNNKQVLHLVDKETGFQNGTFITNKSAENIWNDFVNYWTLVYNGFP